MKKIQFFIIFFTLAGFLVSGCIKSTIVGDDILNKDEINVKFIDTFSLTSKTLKNDSLRVFPTFAKSFLLGQLDNPYTGKATADLFMDFQTLNTVPDSNIFDFDSIVLTVIVDTSLFFGNRDERYHLQVYELNENIIKSETDTFYSEQTFEYIPQKIAETEFVPLIIDSVTVVEPNNDTIIYGQQLRIKLPDELGKRILSNFENIENDTLFKNIFKGLYINTTVEKNSMIGVSFADSKGQKATKIEVYYDIDSSLQKTTFPIHHIISHFNHDYAGSEIETAFDDTIIGNEYLYIQGMVGSKLEIEIPDFEFLKDKSLNKASLFLYTVNDENIKEDLPSRLIAYTKDSTGVVKFVDDFTFSLDIKDPGFYFGYGTETEVNGIKTTKYVINLSLFLKKLVEKNIYNTKIIIVPENRINNPGFAKFYGPKNNILNSKLNIVYSNKN